MRRGCCASPTPMSKGIPGTAGICAYNNCAMEENLRQLRDIIRQKSLRIGDFTLTSGKKSSYYLDCRMTTLDPHGALLIARLILDSIRTQKIQTDALGGLTIGAQPIATAVAVVSAIEGHPLAAFIVRKDTKAHG